MFEFEHTRYAAPKKYFVKTDQLHSRDLIQIHPEGRFPSQTDLKRFQLATRLKVIGQNYMEGLWRLGAQATL